ncbi:hypothetical protein [Pseudalkalibacillus caeni]|uniref:Dimethylamine monooxygenase subunit DmmA-like C-terminal domain-containing protein n=1 Tax=Exobacillus caeni TaxID=2574798 RepID=A0A5R9EXY2_9BACL|nr:hypothetical protein [Pseudalkalibacillus caeni]TLS35977.1 hypothetical protein FCL54_17445 [Pseudalkalibacillus caeni]
MNTEKATFIPDKRKYLFLTDQKGLVILQHVIDAVVESNLPFELVFIGGSSEDETPQTDVSMWLSQQKMGNFLYVSLQWDKLDSIKRLAEDIGFSNEEAQYIGYGEKKTNVFCCRCHGITVVREKETSEEKELPEIRCKHCDLLLSVSDHYSSLRDAYLGYVAKL